MQGERALEWMNEWCYCSSLLIASRFSSDVGGYYVMEIYSRRSMVRLFSTHTYLDTYASDKQMDERSK